MAGYDQKLTSLETRMLQMVRRKTQAARVEKARLDGFEKRVELLAKKLGVKLQ